MKHALTLRGTVLPVGKFRLRNYLVYGILTVTIFLSDKTCDSNLYHETSKIQ